LTRRFDIGPFVLALASLVLLVSLFLPWINGIDPDEGGPGPQDFNAWRTFEITDLVLAALAIAALVGAIGLITPAVDYVERRFIPWIVGVAFVVMVNEILAPTGTIGTGDLGTGAWIAFGATIVMALGTLLSLGKVHFAVAVEGRDRRRRVSAVDHRPPPTESGEPVQRSGASLLDDPPEAGKES
jgi:hypothetical protein